MSRKLAANLAIVGALAASTVVLAQDSAAPPLSLSGTYSVERANVGETTVSMTFNATVTNNSATDIKGPIVLRHPNIIQKVYYRFGEQSIAAGKNVKISGVVTVPRDEYDSWASGGPSLLFYTQNDRGDIKTFGISLSRVPAPAPAK